jgi:hypothetical protein
MADVRYQIGVRPSGVQGSIAEDSGTPAVCIAEGAED